MSSIESKHAKYDTINPISKKLVSNFLKNISGLYASIDVSTIFDGGCGEGFVLHTLNMVKPLKQSFAIDLNRQEVEDAKKNLPFCKVQQGSLYEIPFDDNSFELVISSEVLEHLDDPIKGLQELHRVANKYAILSVPREPIWRMLNMARFKYWDKLGNTPDHLNHWSKNGFIKFVEPYFKIIEIKNPLPWTMILGEKISK